MSVMAAIDLAITLQLVADGKVEYQNYKLIMGAPVPAAPPAPAIAGHGYDATTLSTFLQRVAMQLKCDTPALNFDWVAFNTQTGVNANRETLIGMIARLTQEDGGK